jgi:nucleotide-binding universal stress UspA family protein
MYRRILVAIENSASDRTILDHVEPLAKLMGSELLLVHVADGVVARHLDDLELRESQEMRADRAYLDKLGGDLLDSGIPVKTILAAGDPASELIRVAQEESVDLIAMSTHGHRFLSDLLHGATVDRLRHLVNIPVLLLKAEHVGLHSA